MCRKNPIGNDNHGGTQSRIVKISKFKSISHIFLTGWFGITYREQSIGVCVVGPRGLTDWRSLTEEGSQSTECPCMYRTPWSSRKCGSPREWFH